VEARLIRRVRSDWRDVTLVCGKCSKKIGGGFGDEGKTSLAKALRRALGGKKGRKGSRGVAETKCLGVCPKRAVVVARGGADWLIVPEGSDVAEVVRALGPSGW
jgi:predicted metal-binding protein